jgi:hypothetical protein
MTFRYRFVRFGTTFTWTEGSRDAHAAEAEPWKLYENEIAVDVGGSCLGCDGSSLNVIDHHFFSREGTIPSATCAVMHHGPELVERFGGHGFKTIWLVAHRDADFDAYAAMYLVRWLLTERPAREHWHAAGILAGGRPAANVHEFDWYEPRRTFARLGIDDDVLAVLRWAILLASYAAHVDNARRIFVPRERALHSVLYAGLLRGRPFCSSNNGAFQLFADARRRIEAGLDPLYDVVLERDGEFAPEFALLDRELVAYERDLRRGRRAIVYAPVPAMPFAEAYERIAAVPLLDDSTGEVQAVHLHTMDGGRRLPLDAIYLRDPECLLFKEWARVDVDASSMHQGFTFTFVVYSHERSDGKINTANYFVALDPELAGNAQLYTVWARLQAAEIAALRNHPAFEGAHGHARPGFAGRAGSDAAFFDDPWFDSPNYRCTLVATPTRGTFIGQAGTSADCRDDPVAELVRQELETWVYASRTLQYRDVSAARDTSASVSGSIDVRRVGNISPAPPTCFRFATVRLQDAVDFWSSTLALQIAHTLWTALHPTAKIIEPEVLRAHLFRFGGLLGVWSRAGVAIAYMQYADGTVETLSALFDAIADCARKTDELVRAEKCAAAREIEMAGSGAADLPDRVAKGDEIMRTLVETWHALALPEGRLLNNFVDEIRLAAVARSARDLSAGTKVTLQNDRLGHNIQIVADVQKKVEWLELLFVGIYATEIGHIISEYAIADAWRLVATLCVAALLTSVAASFLRPWSRTEGREQPSSRRESTGQRLLWAFFGIIVLGLVIGVVTALDKVPAAWEPFLKTHPHATATPR